MNIVVTNLYNMYNLGSVHDLMLLKKLLPDSKIYVFSLFCLSRKMKGVVCLNKKIEKPIDIFINMKNFASTIRNTKFWRNIDIIIDLAGDTLNDVNYSVFHPFLYFLNLLPAFIYRIPYIIFFQSIGPFKWKVNKLLASFIIKKAALVIVRETYSFKYVVALNQNSLLFLTPLVIKPRKREREKIGILVDSNLAFLLKSKGYNPIKFYQELIFLLYKVFRKKIILLAQSTFSPSFKPFKNVNDVNLIEKIKKNVKVPIETFISPNLENFISQLNECEFCITSRFHSTLFLLSLNIPFLCLSYTFKTKALLTDAKMKNHMLDLKNFLK